MTSIICWINNEDTKPSLWVIADSRLSKGAGDQLTPLIDTCPKISSIPVKLVWDETFPLPREVYSIGFSYSGSALVANIVKDILTLMLGSLKRINTGQPRTSKDPEVERFWRESLHCFNDEVLHILPSVEEVANLAVEIISQVVKSYSSCNDKGIASEIIVYGFCHKENKYKCFSITCYEHKPDIDREEVVFGDSNSQNYYIAGDKKEEIEELILEKKKSKNKYVYNRAPLYALSEVIESENLSTIGGYIHFAKCDKYIGVSVGGFAKLNGKYDPRYYGYTPLTQDNQGHDILRGLGGCILAPATMSYPDEESDF